MNGRFTEAQSDRNSIKQTQVEHSISLARLETLVKLSITLKGYTLDQVDKLVDEETTKQEKK
jgi:hypothetical protein